MIPKISIITAPDIIFNQAHTLLLVQPAQDLRIAAEQYCMSKECSINAYIFTDTDTDIRWLLTVAKIVDYVIVDMDNCNQCVTHFMSYLLSIPNTYYRTTHEVAPWKLINQNRFYDFPDFERED